MNKDVLQAKKDSVKEITDGLKNSSTMVVVSYQGLTVAELTELRRKLAEKQATMGVYKNTLVARALADSGYSVDKDFLQGPNAFVFSQNVSDGAAICAKFARYHEKLVVRGGYVQGQPVDAAGMKDVAKLPSKEVLLSMFCMVLNEPVAGFARAVKSIADKKPAEAAAPAAAAPAAN
jgi:large subunit ribosomal protein L10